MTYADSIAWLYRLQRSGIKLGLENMRALCAAIGHPERKLKFIHVAGTNGKGSTCAMIESMLRAAGYRTGLYCSPHLISFGERIQVNRTPMGAEDLAEAVGYFQGVVEELRATQVEPTFFEVTTAMAFRHFLKNGVDLVVLETGLGGRLDSTNVVDPECAVITGIAMDHQEYLGHSLGEIAREKAGILKPARPALWGRLPAEAEAVIRQAAAQRGSTLHRVEEAVAGACRPTGQQLTWGGRHYSTALIGRHQAHNAALALGVCELLQENGWSLPEAARVSGLASVRWEGRFQIVSTQPLRVIDGSHNPQGVEATLQTWRELAGRLPQRTVFGCLGDKDVAALAGLLDSMESEIWLVPVDSGRAAGTLRLSGFFPRSRCREFASVAEALAEAWKEESELLVTGSLYLAGEALAWHQQCRHEVLLNG